MGLDLHKNDSVIIIAGRERGKTGKVLKVIQKKDRVLIERVNLVKRHVRQGGSRQAAGIVEKEASIHISNLMLMCDKCNAPVRVGRKVLGDGRKVRMCRRCGDPLD